MVQIAWQYKLARDVLTGDRLGTGPHTVEVISVRNVNIGIIAITYIGKDGQITEMVPKLSLVLARNPQLSKEPMPYTDESKRLQLLERANRLRREAEGLMNDANRILESKERAQAVEAIAGTLAQFTGLDGPQALNVAQEMANYGNEIAKVLMPFAPEYVARAAMEPQPTRVVAQEA